jgi:hypothetical protein
MSGRFTHHFIFLARPTANINNLRIKKQKNLKQRKTTASNNSQQQATKQHRRIATGLLFTRGFIKPEQ